MQTAFSNHEPSWQSIRAWVRLPCDILCGVVHLTRDFRTPEEEVWPTITTSPPVPRPVVDRAIMAARLMRVVGMLGDGAPDTDVIRELIGLATDLGATVRSVGDGLYELLATRRADDFAAEICRFAWELDARGEPIPRRQLKELARIVPVLQRVVRDGEEANGSV